MNKINILKKIIFITLIGIVCIGLLIFLPAGNINYRQGWLFFGSLLIPMLFIIGYFLKNNPGFLEKRIQYKEKEKSQNLIIKLSQILFIIGFLITGLDHRYQWSNVPIGLVIMANIIILISYLFIFRVFKVNSYASRIVKVEKNQKVISTGPYKYIRHPMYIGSIILYLNISFALGSYYAVIIFILASGIIFYRIIEEEKLLKKELDGYTKYTKKVPYRLIPGLW